MMIRMQMRDPDKLQVEEDICQFIGTEDPQQLSYRIFATIEEVAALPWNTKQGCRHVSVLGR